MAHDAHAGADDQLAIPFVKMHAAGNDFVLLVALEECALPIEEQLWPQLARDICARSFGVGADGLLVVQPSRLAYVRMRMFNPDGTEDMCGNGLRCITRHLFDNYGAPDAFEVETIAGTKAVAVTTSRSRPPLVWVEMGEPKFSPRDIPARTSEEHLLQRPLQVVDRSFTISVVSVGTPHAVIVNHPALSDAEWARYSAAIENHALFPERISVTWVTVSARDVVCARVWERAVGETLACGTGACAAVVVAALHGLAERAARVVFKGGDLFIEWRKDNQIVQTGPAEEVYRGTYLWKPVARNAT